MCLHCGRNGAYQLLKGITHYWYPIYYVYEHIYIYGKKLRENSISLIISFHTCCSGTWKSFTSILSGPQQHQIML